MREDKVEYEYDLGRNQFRTRCDASAPRSVSLGKEVEGELITAVELISKSDIQQHVWNKHKKEIKYQWFYSLGDGEHPSFEPLPSQLSC
ncbi:hypothetical protein OPV22_016947 [Ensete ventricosum]|uniref:BAH domain-containing protein n=1 Tax=Ensete ventricosum TaxID=4639 RepID=A0AAV8QWW4_ENSVE|nr:hypothetical protein OPV22_016947 [Ensete ventricosum]